MATQQADTRVIDGVVYRVERDNRDEEYKCYMPAYVVNRGGKGKVFVYEGLVKKTDRSGRSFHKVVFLEPLSS